MISESPKISVIVPCYRTERWLDRCVTSLVTQTLQDIEIILVDDGSPDRVPAICDEWAAKDARIKVIHQRNAGQGPARNAGLDIAKGEYVAFVDSDDWIDADAYRAAYEEVERENGIDIVVFGTFFENQGGRWEQWTAVPERMQWKGAVTVKAFVRDCLSRDVSFRPQGTDIVGNEQIIGLFNSIRRRDLMETHRIRFSSARVQQDLLYGIEFALRCSNIVWLPACYYHYCYNDVSVSHSFDIGKYDSYRDVHRALSTLDSDPLYLQGIDRIFIHSTRWYVFSLVASGSSGKIRQLRHISGDSVWQEVRKRYDLSRLPLYSRIVLYLVYTEHPLLLYLWARLVNFAKYLRKNKRGRNSKEDKKRRNRCTAKYEYTILK